MDLEEKIFKEMLDDQGYTKKFKHMMTDLYMKAYHEGRHAERYNLRKDGFLIIDPERIDELKNRCIDPCLNCDKRADYLKIGCKENPKECKIKQQQLRALEIMSWFNK